MPMERRRSRRHVVKGLAASALGAAAWPGLAHASQAVPRAVVDAERVDLGVVAIGSEPEIRFVIRNEGSAPLTLAPGRIAQGLRLDAIESPIAPGASGQVRLRLDTFQAGGRSDWTIPLTTNDPQRATLVLQVHADVRTYILITPPSARFTYVQYEREGGTTHVVGAAGHEAFAITRVQSPYPFIDVSFAEAPADTPRPAGVDGRLWVVTTRIRREAGVGPLAGSIVIETNHPRQARAWLDVTGFVRPLFAVTPPGTVTLDVPHEIGQAPLTSLTVAYFGEAPATLSVTDVSIPGLSAELVPPTAGHRWRLDVRAATTLKPGAFRGRITLRTSRPEVPTLIVPIEGRRAAP